MKNVCDCIIPFFNEDLRPLCIIKLLQKSNIFSKIIAIDDGSADKALYLKIKKDFPDIILVRLEKNSGKTNAIKTGLKFATAEYVFLIDGDHINLKINEIKNAVYKIINNPQLDMIILRKIEDETVKISRCIRHDTIFSGERILKRSDLKKVFQNKFSDYQIEMAINTYMIRGKKKAFWMPSSAHSFNKWQKWGLCEGSKRAWKMFIGFVSYAGWWNFIRQTLFFCRQEAP